MDRYKSGTLVEINTLRSSTAEGFGTARAAIDGSIVVTEFIDLETFPSWNDYHGEEIICWPNQTGTIISFLGRPSSINRSSEWWEYDVYEVLINKTFGRMEFER